MFARLHGWALAGLVATLATGAAAQDQLRDRDRVRDPATHEPGTEPDRLRTRDRDRINEVLKTDGKLSDAEVAALAEEVDAYAARKGELKQLRSTVRATVREGCTGPCLATAVREMNRAMSRGARSSEAGKMVQAAVREERRERARTRTEASAEERGEKVRARVEAQLEKRERAQERKAAAAKARERERDRDRASGKEPAVERGKR